MLPAHNSKHLTALPIDGFLLTQSDSGQSNGSALWLSGQVLAMYLRDYLPNHPSRLPICELGAGIGYTALVAASLGFDVLASDLPPIVSSVLHPNISRASGSTSGKVTVASIDWLNPVDATTLSPGPPFSLIISADTVYSSDLVEPLINTLRTLCILSSPTKPTVLIGIERRDPLPVDEFLTQASSFFKTTKIPRKKLVRAMEKALGSTDKMWADSDWEGVELWKFNVKSS